MIASPFRSLILMAAAGIGLGGCTDGYGYSGLSLGYGSGGYYDDGWYGAGYGGPGYGGAFGSPYWGWWGDYYYPGTGYYVYDRYNRPFRWNDRQRGYWEGRARQWRGDRRANWGDFRRDGNRGAYDGGRWNGRGDDRRWEGRRDGDRRWEGRRTWNGTRPGTDATTPGAVTPGTRPWRRDGVTTPGAGAERRWNRGGADGAWRGRSPQAGSTPSVGTRPSIGSGPRSGAGSGRWSGHGRRN